ncbi:MAG: SprB repeat-containing protein [Bacteroidota bacterium]
MIPESNFKRNFLACLIVCIAASQVGFSQAVISLVPSNYNGYNISCFGSHDGTIHVSIDVDGNPPYTYQWSNNDSTQDITNLAAGYYHVVVIDANDFATHAEITLQEPETFKSLTLSKYIFGNGKNVSCHFCFDGSITTTLSGGGVTPYSYQWSDGAVTKNRTGINAGNYQVVVTDANGCTISAETSVLAPDRDDWTTTGNTGSTAGTNFIGTTDSKDVVFKSYNTEQLRLKSNGETKLSGIAGTGNRILFIDQNGIVKGKNILLDVTPAPACTDPNIFAFQQNPNYPLSVYTCWNKVGIGTDNPQTDFHVKGDARFSYWQDLTKYTTMGHDGANAFIYNRGAGALLINYVDPGDQNPVPKDVAICAGASGNVTLGGNNYLAPDNGKKVGIGTTSPSSKLDVYDNSSNAQIRVTNSGSQPSSVWTLNADLSYGFGVEKNTQTNKTVGHIYADAGTNGGIGTKLMTFTNDGFIGIGTDDPQEALQIGDRFTIHNGGNKVIGYNFRWDSNSNENKKLVSDESSAIYFNYDGSLSFQSENDNTAAPGSIITWKDNLHIASDGKVGVGMAPNQYFTQYSATTILGVKGTIKSNGLWITSGSDLSVNVSNSEITNIDGSLNGFATGTTLLNTFSFDHYGNFALPGLAGDEAPAKIYCDARYNPKGDFSSIGIWVKTLKEESINLKLNTQNEATKAISINLNTTNDGTDGTENFCVYGNGGVRARNIKLTSQIPFPDYVFNESFTLLPIMDLKNYIENNNHLPDVPTAEEVKKNGLDVEKLLITEMQKIEELTLYIIELEKKINKLEDENHK